MTRGRAVMIVLALMGLAACATVAPTTKNYATIRQEAPRSILVVPVLNNSVNITAPDFFLSTISRPFAERGYYVFPANMVRSVLQNDGLADPGLVHGADPRRLGTLFGCDSVLLVKIQRWDSQYVIVSTKTTVKFDYMLKSCRSGEVLWEETQELAYSPQANNSSGNPLADLLAQAIVAAMEKGAPNYMPLTIQANAAAAGTPGKGLPAGPYLPALYGKDKVLFPSAP